MKKNFSFGLGPMKVPSKPAAHAKASPDPTPAHGRHRSKDSITSLNNTPFISRRLLPQKTEHELRAACALILHDFKPSGHGLDDQAKPKLDFQIPSRRTDARSGPSQVRVHKPTGAPAEPRGAHDARKHGHRDPAVKDYPHLPMRANTGRRREQPAQGPNADVAASKDMRGPSMDYLHRPATAQHPELESTDAASLQTPLTSSTDAHLNNGSTAPTSAALTSGRSSKRGSRHFDTAAALADAQAAEWMKHELEKRRLQQASQPELKSPSNPPPTRARSIRSGIRDYFLPGSAALSRSQSSDSLRSQGSGSASQRSGSAHGWRSWGLARGSSSRSNSRPGTSKGRIENQPTEKKSSINLNRELPPLPSLDSWNQQEQQPKPLHKPKAPAAGAHIASLMRPQEQQQQQQDYAAAVRKHHRRSGSDTLAVRYANAKFPQPPPQTSRSPSAARHAPVAASPRRSPNSRQDSSQDFTEMMTAMDSTRNLDEQLKLTVNGHARQHSHGSASRATSIKMSSDGSRLDLPPNFSRKISTDVPPTLDEEEHMFSYPNVVHLSPPPEMRKHDSNRKLRKVFSGWMLGKDRKKNWMSEIEKNGIKGGVMIQDEAALPPVVRY